MKPDLIGVFLQTALLLVLAPLVSGLVRNWKAKLQNRRGPPVWQPYFDILKFLGKDMVISEHTSWVFVLAPYVVFLTALLAGLMVPVVANQAPLSLFGGVLAVVGVAIYSGWKLVRRQSSLGGLSTSNILWANVLILLGDLLNGLAGTLARFLGLESTFWLVMSLGWVLFLAGVLLASQRSAAKTAAPQERNQKEYASS